MVLHVFFFCEKKRKIVRIEFSTRKKIRETRLDVCEFQQFVFPIFGEIFFSTF